MAKCRDCGKPVVWATITGGKSDGKKRCFDPDGSEKGRYGLSTTEETDNFGKQLVRAVYYDDPLKGLENHDELFEAHYQTCENTSKNSGGRVPSLSAGPKVFAMVQIGSDDYTGYLDKKSKVEKDDAPF